MRHISTIAWLTFREAWRRRMVLAALGLGVVFLLLFLVGFWLINQELGEQQVSTLQMQFDYNMLMMAGFYVLHFLTVMLAIFASVDTVAGEITSHTVQTIVTKSVRRWEVLIGKWLGYLAMLVLYLGLLGGGMLGSVYLMVGYVPPNPIQGLLLLVLEAQVLLSLSLFGGTLFSTLTNGVILFMLYGLAFIGSWVEQIGALLQSPAAVRVGIITSLVMPVEALWHRAAYLMQTPLARNLPISPFGGTSTPSAAMVVYALLYAMVALLFAVRMFSQRDL